MESLFAKPNLKLLRRFLAVVLTLLSLLFLFWPAMVAYSADYREDRLDYYAERYREYEDYSRSDAKAAARAYVAENNVMGYSFLELRNQLSAEAKLQSLEDKYTKKNWEDSYLSGSYDSFKDYLKDLTEGQKTMRSLIGTGSVFVNILFFGLLAAGLAAVALYMLNGTRAAGIAFAALAVLADVFCIVLLASAKKFESDLTAPGVSMFLLPLFAIAACIVYQRAGKAKRAPRAPRPAPVPNEGGPFMDAPRRAPRQKPEGEPFADDALRNSAEQKPAENPFMDAPRMNRQKQKPAENPFAAAPRFVPQQPAENPFTDAPRPVPQPKEEPAAERTLFAPPEPLEPLMKPAEEPTYEEPEPAEEPTYRGPEPAEEPTYRGPEPEEPAEEPRFEEPAEEPTYRGPEPEKPVEAPAPEAGDGWTCPRCGKVNMQRARFCVGCGMRRVEEEKPAACPVCGSPCKPGAVFCTHCGARLS